MGEHHPLSRFGNSQNHVRCMGRKNKDQGQASSSMTPGNSSNGE